MDSGRSLVCDLCLNNWSTNKYANMHFPFQIEKNARNLFLRTIMYASLSEILQYKNNGNAAVFLAQDATKIKTFKHTHVHTLYYD